MCAVIFGGSGAAFLVSMASLIAVEGPGSPDVLTTLASPSGRHIFDITVAAGIAGAIMYPLGAAILFILLRAANELAMLIVLVLAPVVTAVLVVVLAVEYTPVAAAREGFSTDDTWFRQLVVSAHAFADVGGWASVAMLAFTVFLVSTALRRAKRWPLTSLAGFAFVLLAIALFLLDSSYAFLLAFGLWEIVIALGFMVRPLKLQPA
jgi:hypothetical protein